MKKTAEAPPSYLSAEARALWRRLARDFHLDDAAALALLRALCEAHDRCQDARRTIKREGAVLRDRFQQPKVHPSVLIERDARTQMLHALRALRLAPDEVAP